LILVKSLISTIRSTLTVGLACFALLAGCEEGASPAAATAPASNGPVTPTDALHNAQTTTGGPVDSSKLGQALSICLDNIPDMGAARQQMILAGFQREGSIEGQDLYSAADRSVFALLSVGSDIPRCAVGRDSLRDQGAVTFAENALRQAYGPTFFPADPADFSPPVIAGWIATPASGTLAIGVTPVLDLPPFFLGSFILVTTNVTDTGDK
jgi:hypothetical protein